MPDGISIEDYLKYLEQPSATNTNLGNTTDPMVGTTVSAPQGADYAAAFGPPPAQEITSDNVALDILGQLTWGAISGLTWGASEFVAKSKPWEEMNDWEKGAWATGEGLSLFTPLVGPFALLGKGGQIATKALRGNRYIRKAASDLVKHEGLLADQIVDKARKRGVLPKAIAEDLQKQFKKQLPRELKDKYSVENLRNLSADALTAESAKIGLKAQGDGIISRILTDSGMDVSAGLSRELSEQFVEELGKGRYVNDIGEWFTRGLGGRNPGRISQYMGMAANDFLYMGLHALGTEKIDAMAHDRAANYADIPKHTLIMSLGFPLIRGIGKGGRESLTRGINSYYQRFKKINYNKVSKSPNGDTISRELLRKNVKGANIGAVFNNSKLGEQFYTIGKTTYTGKEDILARVDAMPLDHVVGLLNKMRLATSKEMVNRFKKNYFGDLAQSLPRMGTGILFMNYGAFQDGSFDGMSEQELASHLFMGALMTKGRGAWDHAGRRGYIHSQYGDMTKALEFLQVDASKMLGTINYMKQQELYKTAGVVYGANPVADNIVNIFDGIFIGNKVDWTNKGEYISRDKYAKVEEMLGAYNAIKKSQNESYDFLSIDQMNPNALDIVKKDIGVLKIGQKTIDQMEIADIAQMLSAETHKEIQSDYFGVMELMRERLEMPFSEVPAVEGLMRKATAYQIKGPDGITLPNIMAWNNLLVRHSKLLNIDVLSEATKPKEASTLSRNMGLKVRDFDNALGEVMNQFLVEVAGRHKGHNLGLTFADNIFLDGLSVIKQNKAKSDIYKVVTGTETDSPEVRTLREAFMNVFGIEGKLHKDIFKNEIEGKVGDEIKAVDAENLSILKPLYDLVRDLSPTGKSEFPKRNINSGDLKEVAEKASDMIGRLPQDWKIDLYGEGLKSFQERLFKRGNPLSYAAYRRAVDANLIEPRFDKGVHKIIFPDEVAIRNHLSTDKESAAKVQEAVQGVKDLFTPQLVDSSPVVKEGIDMLQWITIHNEIGHGKVKDFVKAMPDILKNLGKDSLVITQIKSVKDLANEIKSEIENPRKVLDVEKIDKALKESKLIHETLLMEGKIDQVSSDKMKSIIDALEIGVRDIRSEGVPHREVSIDNFGKMVNSIDEMIISQVEADHVKKSSLARLLVDIENHLTQKDPHVGYVDGKILLENLTNKFHKTLGDKLSEEMPLQKLIDEFNNSGNWRDAEAVIESVVKMKQSFNPHQDTYNKAATNIYDELQHFKLNHERPVNFQELLTRYPSLQDPVDSNKMNNKFIAEITNAFDPAMGIEPKSVLDKYVYKDIRDNIDSGEQQTKIDEFNAKEMKPILQSIFGKTEVDHISLDHQFVKHEKKKINHSLSTMTLDRRYTADPEIKYDYALLQGTIKIGGRTINMDQSFELGGDWTIMQNVIDRAIPVDFGNMKTMSENLRDINFELNVENLRTIGPVENSSKVYMRLSPKLRIVFPKTKENIDLLNRDFDTIYSEKINYYDSQGSGYKKRTNAFKKAFEHLYNTTEHDNDILRLKMQFIHMNRTMPSEFDKMMNRMDADRGKIEFNSFKRGMQADGQTSTAITKEALEWSVRYDADRDVRNVNQRMLDTGIEAAVIGDESVAGKGGEFFSNKRNVLKQLQDKFDDIITASQGEGTIESSIVNEFNSRIKKGEFPSLESFLLDGGKFSGTPFAKSIRGFKGGGKWNGMKTTIMSGDILGKGFTIYNPDIARFLDAQGIDLLMGRTVAKTLASHIKPFEIDPSKTLQSGWETELRNLPTESRFRLPYENFGISFTTHSDPGVNYSSSMFDFQDVSHLRKATKLFKIDEIISKMGAVNNNRDYANGNLLKALYKIREQESGLQLTAENYTLTETLLDYGARESNPLVQKDLIRLLQSDFYKILTKRPTPHGEEGIIAPDVDNVLTNPIYAQIDNIPRKNTSKPGSVYSAFQYGGSSITKAMADQKISRDVDTHKIDLQDIPFIARDPKSGLDIAFSFTQKGIEFYSPLLEVQKQIKEMPYVEPTSGIKGLEKRGRWIEVPEKTFKEVKSVLNQLNKQVSGMKNVTYGDVIKLLNGESFQRNKRHTERVPIGLGKNFAKLSKKYNIDLGQSINAIPKVVKDQPLTRVQQVLGKELNGLSTINSFDLRVVLQRDHDGDHAYKYLKMPFGMLKDYMADMGDVVDFKPMDNLKYSEMNMFGFRDGVAGKNMQSIGFDKVAHDIAKKKRILSSVISRKGTLSYLLNSNLKLDGESFVHESFNKKNIEIATEKALDIFQRSGDLTQAMLDVWKKTPEISDVQKAVEEYYVYGKHSNFDNPSLAQSKDSFLKEGFGSLKFEKDIFDIMHRALSKAKIMDNDVYDAAGQRQPTTSELRKAKRDIEAFFKNPDHYLIKKLLGNARRLRKKGKGDEADVVIKDIIGFFYPKVSVNSKSYDNLAKTLKKGKIDPLRGQKRFSAEESLGIKSSISGHILDEAIKNPVFYQPDNKAYRPVDNNTLLKNFNNLQDKIEMHLAFGGVTPESISEMLLADRVLTKVEGGERVFDSNMNGIYRYVANSQHERAVKSLYFLRNENFPDANKIERAEDRISTLRTIVDAMDRQMANSVVLEKGKDLTVKSIKAREGSKWDYRDFKLNGNLYKIKGDIKPKEISKYKDSIEYVGLIKEGKKTRVERGYTYVIDKRPPKFNMMSDPEVKWNIAWRSATFVDMLKARDVDPRLNENNPIVYNKFLQEVDNLRRDVSRGYSRAIDAGKKSIIDKTDIFYLNSVETDRQIGRFYRDYATPENIERLTRFLLQPQIQRNVYIKEGPRELPYHKMNTHLIESVFNWMMRPPTKERPGIQESYGFDAKTIIKTLIHDMNAFHDHRLDQVQFKVDKYNQMKIEGKVDFNRLRETTTDILLSDWFHNPVLSKFSRDFFLGKGDLVRAKDINGKDNYYYDYSRGKSGERMEKLMGCD